MTMALASSSHHKTAPRDHAVTGSIHWLLRLEGALALTLSVIAFRDVGGTWALFAVLFLVPDATMLGYLINPAVGAWIYNAGHTYLAPGALALAGLLLGQPLLYALAAIWSAHIGWDRLAGYGLKYASSFHANHLQIRTTK